MHPNPIYRSAQDTQNIAFARSRGFGVLSVNGEAVPRMAHVPFILDENASTVSTHLVRSNPILRLLDTPKPAVITVSGGDGYISPDWYGVDDQVPTWNYVAVTLTGTLHRLPQDNLRDILDRTSAHFETQLAPKTAWTTGKMTPEVLDRMMRQIVPIALQISAIDGTWKLSQNKSKQAQANVVQALTTTPDNRPIGQNTDHLAQLMRAALKDKTP